MKTEKILLALIFALIQILVAQTIASAQGNPLWGNLKAGKYAVGYRAMYKYDHSRVFMPERNYEGKLNTSERSRPLHIQIFYPAMPSAKAAGMTYGEYLDLKSDTPAATTVSESLRFRNHAVHNYFLDLYLKEQKNGLYEKLLKLQAAAVRNALGAKGKYPIIIFAGGASHSTDENVVLWEYLASHGYIVGFIPATGTSSADFRPSSGDFRADAIGLETETRDLEFLLEDMRRMPFAEPNRIGAMGYSYGGQAALLLAMRNSDIDAVVGLDSSFISVDFSKHLKNSPFYNIDNVTAPILEIHMSAPHVTYEVTDALRYSPRYSFDIKGLAHIDFNSYPLLYSAVLPKDTGQNSPIAEKKAAYEAMARYILDFLDVYLKGNKTKSSNLTKPVEWKGYPAEAVSFRYSEALTVPPSYADLIGIIRERGIARAERIYQEIQKRDSKAAVVSEQSINKLGYELLNSDRTDEAIRVFLWNVEKHPRSANVYDSLADGYRKKGALSCVAYSYHKLLETLPLDITSSESVKTFLLRNTTEQLEKLKNLSVNGKCDLEKQ